MRGCADLGVGSRITVGTRVESVATSQEIAIIGHGAIECGGINVAKGAVIGAEPAKGSTAIAKVRAHTDELIQGGEDKEGMVNTRCQPFTFMACVTSFW